MTRKISCSELSQHSTPDSAWLVVNGIVYDLTEFAPSHPGGTQVIYRYAGRDASEEYNMFHAPSLIGNTLKAACHIGALDQDTITEDWLSKKGDGESQLALSSSNKPPLHSIINLYDFENVARDAFNRKAWGYINGASNDNLTRDGNIGLLKDIWFRPAVMRNVKSVNTKADILGCSLEMPIYISPVGTVRIAGDEGELAFAKAAASSGIIQCISTASSYPLEEILDATAERAFFQLYVNRDRSQTESLLKRVAASSKVKAIFITADLPVISKREDDERAEAADHDALPGQDKKLAGVARQNASFIDPQLSWKDIAWIRTLTDLPLVVKGIQRWEDAKLAVQYGCQGIVVSNHGGRAADTAQPAILSLLELHKNCPEVFDHLQVLIDGGFRRGSDVVKAICLGASAVGFGRPLMYSVQYGTEGVVHAIEILRDEIETAMRLCGMVNLTSDASPRVLNTRLVDHLVYEAGNGYIRERPNRNAKL